RPTAISDCAGRVVDAPKRYAVQRRAKAVVELPNELPRLHVYVVEADLRFVATDVPEQADHALDFETGRIGRNEECRDAAGAFGCAFGVGDREYDAVVGGRHVRRPYLATADAPTVAVAAGTSR